MNSSAVDASTSEGSPRTQQVGCPLVAWRSSELLDSTEVVLGQSSGQT